MSGLRQFWQRWQSLILIIGAAVWTVITAGASAYWSVRQFQATSEQFQSRLAFERETRDNARASAEHEAATTRRIEAQKPFLQKKLDAYFEAIKVTSRLVEWELLVESPVWKENANRFWQMRWGELEMVGDAGIRNAARLVGEQIKTLTEIGTIFVGQSNAWRMSYAFPLNTPGAWRRDLSERVC
jgi:hypothetical protein